MEYTYDHTNEHQIAAVQRQLARAGSDCGCGGPRMLMPSGPGGPGGPGMPPPGLFPPGPGPFPPGPGPFPPGPGPFPPGPGPFPPGPGPFPPPRPPFPFPFPFPFPVPYPIPYPFPGHPFFVTVVINGGRTFPNVTQAYRVPFRPGLTIYQALAGTGVVRFTFNGQIASVSGVPIGGNISYQLQLNGRVIPPSLLNYPVQPNDSVALQLIYNPFFRVDEEEVEEVLEEN